MNFLRHMQDFPCARLAKGKPSPEKGQFLPFPPEGSPMRMIDCRSREPSIDADESARRTNVVLGEEFTCLFHDGVGNHRTTWRELEPMLFRALPGGFHGSIGDISVGDQQDVELRVSRDEPDAAAWFCRELVARRIVPESAPVTAVFPDGEEYLGPADQVANSRVIPVRAMAR